MFEPHHRAKGQGHSLDVLHELFQLLSDRKVGQLELEDGSVGLCDGGHDGVLAVVGQDGFVRHRLVDVRF